MNANDLYYGKASDFKNNIENALNEYLDNTIPKLTDNIQVEEYGTCQFN